MALPYFLVVKNGVMKFSLRAVTRAVKSCIVSVDAVVRPSAHYSSAVSQVSAISSRFNETNITSLTRRTLLKVIKGRYVCAHVWSGMIKECLRVFLVECQNNKEGVVSEGLMINC